MTHRLIRSASAVVCIAAACLIPDRAAAQWQLSPYVAGAVGFGSNSTEIPVETSPPTSATYTDRVGTLLASANLGLRVGQHIAADAGIRSSLGMGRPFQALTLGPRIEIASIHGRAAFGRVRGSQEVTCVGSQSDCPRFKREWTDGFDVELGALFPYRGWSLGPTAWWSQSTSGSTKYQSLGAGVAVRLP